MKEKNKKLDFILNDYIYQRLPKEDILAPALKLLNDKNSTSSKLNHKKVVMAACISALFIICLIIGNMLVMNSKYNLAVVMSRGIVSAEMDPTMSDVELMTTNLSINSMVQNEFESIIAIMPEYGAVDYTGIDEQFMTAQFIVQFSAKILLYCDKNNIKYLKNNVSIEFDDEGTLCYLEYKVNNKRVYVSMAIVYSESDISYLRYSYYYNSPEDFNISLYLLNEMSGETNFEVYIYYDKGKTFIMCNEKEETRSIIMASGKTKSNYIIEDTSYQAINQDIDKFIDKFKGYTGYKFKDKEKKSLIENSIYLENAYEEILLGLFDQVESGLVYELLDNNQEYGVRIVNSSERGYVVIPETYKGLPVTTVLRQGFKHRDMNIIIIPPSITLIEDEAFSYCPYLSTIIFNGANPPVLGENVFIQDMPKLKIFVMDSYLDSYHESEYFKEYEDIIHSKSIIDANGYVIEDNVLLQYTGVSPVVNIPDGIEIIADYAFMYNENITSVKIPASVISIGVYSFGYCLNLSNISFDDESSLQVIGSWAFAKCNMSSITIPRSVEIIKSAAFYTCDNLSVLTFEEESNLIIIEEWAFIDCSNLTSISLPESLQRIETMAFAGCINLEFVIIPDSVYYIAPDGFANTKWLNNKMK